MTAETAQPALDAADFEALYQRLRRVPCWGPADRRGALNHLTQDRVLAAAGEIRPDGLSCRAHRNGPDTG
jgi:hypothetical protein